MMMILCCDTYILSRLNEIWSMAKSRKNRRWHTKKTHSKEYLGKFLIKECIKWFKSETIHAYNFIYKNKSVYFFTPTSSQTSLSVSSPRSFQISPQIRGQALLFHSRATYQSLSPALFWGDSRSSFHRRESAHHCLLPRDESRVDWRNIDHERSRGSSLYRLVEIARGLHESHSRGGWLAHRVWGD